MSKSLIPRLNKSQLSQKGGQQKFNADVEGEPLPGLSAAHHIRTSGFPISTGHGSATSRSFLVTNPKTFLIQNNVSATESVARAQDFYSKSNEYHRDRLGYLVP